MTTQLHPLPPSEDYPPRRRWTREEYLRLSDLGLIGPDERVELIGGEILQTPAQKNRHAAAVTKALQACQRCFPSGYWVRVQATLAVGGDDSMPEPDVAVVEGEIEDHPEDYPTSAVLIIEASDTTLAFDRKQKSSLYAAAGIPDYWVQNLVDGCLEVRRNPAPKPDAPFGWDYSQVTVHHQGEQVAPLAAPSCSISVTELLHWRLGPTPQPPPATEG